MNVLAPLVPLLLIAGAIWYVVNLRGMKLFRQALDRSHSFESKMWTTLSAMGEDDATGGSLTHEVFHATLGLRTVSTALIGLLMLVLFPVPLLEDAMPFAGMFAVEEYVLCAVIAGYYLFWVHSYRVEVHGSTLVYRNFLMRQRNLDLRRLEDVEDDHHYCLRLYFDDGSKAEIFKNLTGGVKLRRKLVRWLEINRRL